MVFSFDNQELKDICENEQLALERFSPEFTMNLQSCLAEIEAVKNLGDLPETLWNKPTVIQNGSFVASFPIGNEGARFLFTHNHTPNRQSHIDENWSNVSRIKLLKIKL